MIPKAFHLHCLWGNNIIIFLGSDVSSNPLKPHKTLLIYKKAHTYEPARNNIQKRVGVVSPSTNYDCYILAISRYEHIILWHGRKQAIFIHYHAIMQRWSIDVSLIGDNVKCPDYDV